MILCYATRCRLLKILIKHNGDNNVRREPSAVKDTNLKAKPNKRMPVEVLKQAVKDTNLRAKHNRSDMAQENRHAVSNDSKILI